MTDKLFTTVGTSVYQGQTKLRFATDPTRVKRLLRNGHTNINLVDLPREMTKGQAARYLLEIDFAQGDQAVIDAIQHVLRKNPVSATVVGNTDEDATINDKSPITDRMEPALM